MSIVFFPIVFIINIPILTSAILENESSCWDSTEHDNCQLLPPGDQCGVSVKDPRIVGGKDASLGQYPWIAILYARGTELQSENTLVCGGSLISSQYVLSAAHCCDSDGSTVLSRVRVGEYDLSSPVDCREGKCAPSSQDIPIDNYIIHDQYDPSSKLHDICLIRLQEPVALSEYVSPICLPFAYDFSANVSENATLEVAGWGTMAEDADGMAVMATVLQTLQVPLVPLDQCQRLYQDISSSQLCVGGVEGEDSCPGDSGGPLMATSLDGRQSLLGLVSYGPSGLCGLGLPAVYTNVPYYTSWILDNLRP